MAFCFVVFLLTVVSLVACILIKPSVAIGRFKFKIYACIPLVGALAMLTSGYIGWGEVASELCANTSVNPIKILLLFLSMTVFSLILEQTGFFCVVSSFVLRRAGQSQYVLFFALYVVISVLTVFTSNDIIILTFTPFIMRFCRSGNIDPFPYLFMEFVAANTWSLLLMIGNPTNIYLGGALGLDFLDYVRVMALPTVAAGVVSLSVMMLLFRRKLRRPIKGQAKEERITDRFTMTVALVHLLACILTLSISQYIGLEMWLVSVTFAVSALVMTLIGLLVRKKGLTLLRHTLGGMPIETVPFILGMFVLISGLEHTGLIAMAADAMAEHPEMISYGYGSFLAANVFNNIPMSVLFGKLLAGGGAVSAYAVYATVIGSNLGAFLTPIGALAGIMWNNLLSKRGLHVSFLRFLRYGAVIGIPSITAALLVLLAIF
ncbi:MAG: hypothetical protein E7664_02540 [Ruminococcaceae bacterium]|nr:hypothetical protein [Oscillospiraceae bacterium]